MSDDTTSAPAIERCCLCGCELENDLELDTGVCDPCGTNDAPEDPERLEEAKAVILDHLLENASSRVPMSPEYGDYLIEKELSEEVDE